MFRGFNQGGAAGGRGGVAGDGAAEGGYGTPQPNRSAADAGRIDLHVHLHGGRPGVPAQSGTSIFLSDPVAERRREKALKSLDKRLSELRTKMKGTGAVPLATGAGAMSTP